MKYLTNKNLIKDIIPQILGKSIVKILKILKIHHIHVDHLKKRFPIERYFLLIDAINTFQSKKENNGKIDKIGKKNIQIKKINIKLEILVVDINEKEVILDIIMEN